LFAGERAASVAPQGAASAPPVGGAFVVLVDAWMASVPDLLQVAAAWSCSFIEGDRPGPGSAPDGAACYRYG